jgi:hypothetical protein
MIPPGAVAGELAAAAPAAGDRAIIVPVFPAGAHLPDCAEPRATIEEVRPELAAGETDAVLTGD